MLADPVLSFAFPAIQPDAAGNVFLVMTGTSADLRPSMFATGRLATDSPGTMRPPQVIRAGRGRAAAAPGEAIRWGDYSGIATDPVTGEVWTHGEYAFGQNVGAYYFYTRTWIARTGLETLISTRKLSIRDAAGTVSARFISKDTGLSTGWMNLPAAGAQLRLFNASGGSDSSCVDLSPAGWEPMPGGYRYRSASGDAARVDAKVVPGKYVVVAVSGSGFHYSLDEPAQGSVAFALDSGGLSVCAVAGGTVTADAGGAGGGTFAARKAAAPAACPAPPACS